MDYHSIHGHDVSSFDIAGTRELFGIRLDLSIVNDVYRSAAHSSGFTGLERAPG